MKPARSIARLSASGPWWAVVALLTLSFALGGSARGDVPQLMVLRPAAVLLLGYGLMTLRRCHLRAHPAVWVLAMAIVALPALQLVPLPPAVWHHLPGRELIAGIDRAAGLEGAWRPFSLTPLATRNAFFATLVPMAGLVLAMQLDHRELARLLPVVLVLGGLSALAGLVQVLDPERDWLHLYPITNSGMEVGLFANRNHQAVLLAMMLPMLAVFGYFGRTWTRLVALGCGALLIPLILLTDSRAGLVAAAIGLIAIPLILAGLSRPLPEQRESRLSAALAGWRGPVAGIALAAAGAALVGVTIWLGRGEAWARLTATGGGALDQRIQIMPTLAEMVAAYFPAGTGMGSFERVFQIHEPDWLLRPQVVNHAHNDWIEVVLDGGVPAVLMLGAAAAAFAVGAARAWRGNRAPAPQVALARLGLVLIGLQAASSLVDYPLRTPLHAVLLTIAVLWAMAASESKSELNELDMRGKTNNHGSAHRGGIEVK